jgi:hypothetical protein
MVEPGEIFQEIFWGLELFLVYMGKQSALALSPASGGEEAQVKYRR